MGQYMVEELKRYLANQPLKYALKQESVMRSSHRPCGIPVRELHGSAPMRA
jgi:hypothetical protein